MICKSPRLQVAALIMLKDSKSGELNMSKNFSKLKIIFLYLIFNASLNANSKQLLLISIDGLQPKHVNAETTPNIWQFASEGARAKSLRPIFPSLTFPNHYTLVTGLYSEKHGITGNEIRDPNIPERFSLSAPKEVTNDPRWWIGEPIWVTAQKQGLRSGTLFWPGSEAAIQGILPTYSLPFDITMTNATRVENLLKWIDLPGEKRPHFYTLYFDSVDSAGHRFGPDAPEVLSAIKDADAVLGNLYKALRERDLYDKMNILIVSDHGMAELDEDKAINVTDVLEDFPGLEKVGSTAVVGFFSKNVNQLKKLEVALREKSKLYKVYSKKNIPSRFHYRDSNRIPDILLVAEEGVAITARPSFMPTRSGNRGAHGYDNTLNSMQAVFIARGPDIQEGAKISTFDNIHVYPLMCKLLGISPAKNDGNLSSFYRMLRRRKN